MRILIFFLVAFCSFALSAQDLVILHTNDMHSHLNGLSPEAEYTPLEKDNDPTLGGFSRIAGFISSERNIYHNKLLVVDAGDFLMGTFFQTLELHEGFQLNLMRKMGYEAVALGNHEFDYGPDSLAKIINNSIQNGPTPQILCSNYGGSNKTTDHDLRKLFENGTVLPYTIIIKNGYRIGIFSLMGVDANESIASSFGMKFTNQRKVARQTAAFLKKEEKVDLVLVLSHSGVYLNKKGEWDGEDIKLGKAVPEIDIIISGHSHSTLNSPVQAGNAVVVQTGASGANVGRIEVKFDSYGKPLVQASLVAMDDNIKADPEIQQLIDDKIPWIEEHILSGIGVGYRTIVAETSFDLVLDEMKPKESNLGPFIADAIYYQVNNIEGDLGVDVVMVASGVIRNNIFKGNKGQQNINDIFNVMPLGMGSTLIPGHSLARVFVTGNELKRIMELILAVYPIKPSYFLHFAGMEIEYNPNKRLFTKIAEIRTGNSIDGFKKIDISKKSTEMLSIAANEYMIGFIGQLKKMSFGIVNVVPKNADGSPVVDNNFLIDMDVSAEGIQEAKEWLAIYHYLISFNDTSGNGIPNIPKQYMQKRNSLIPLE